MGIKINKIYRTISYDESPWLKPYIDNNVKNRSKGKTDFEKEIWKLLNNSFYGKTLENIRGRFNIEFPESAEKQKGYNQKQIFVPQIYMMNTLHYIKWNINSVKFDKPIYLGACILDLSKQFMYEYYYNVVARNGGIIVYYIVILIHFFLTYIQKIYMKILKV